jgi:small GTP-binding protein
VGKPNAGKSSLLNKLTGETRSIVSPIPGTTRDAIDTPITWEGLPITLIDTAGIRKRGTIIPGVEKYSVLRAMQAIERCDVALLVIDAVTGVTAQDTHIAGYINQAWKSVILIVNKWDLIEKDTNTSLEFEKKHPPSAQFSALCADYLYIGCQRAAREPGLANGSARAGRTSGASDHLAAEPHPAERAGHAPALFRLRAHVSHLLRHSGALRAAHFSALLQ